MFSSAYLAALAVLAQQVYGHGYVNLLKTGGKSYPGWDLNYYYTGTPAGVAGWSTLALDSGFVSPAAYQSGDIVCHKNGTAAKFHLPVVAGQTVDLQWNTFPAGHSGPVLDYLAPCPKNNCTTISDKTQLSFAKLDQLGLVSPTPAPGDWGNNHLVNQNFTWTVTIPSSIKPGAYVLRHEIIALHGARSDNGAQNYPQCVNLMVSGSGTKTVSGESATAFYTRTDPGILIDIYNNLKNYIVPGPAVATF